MKPVYPLIAAELIALTVPLNVSVRADGQQPFVHGSDIDFSVTTSRRTYLVDEPIVIHYTIRNVSHGALYIPAAQWESRCGNNPHLWSRLEDHLGKHYEPGFGFSCLGPNAVDRMSLSERMRKDASLLNPGQSVTGSFSFDPHEFEGNLKPGKYRLEAVLYGWNQRYDDAQLLELAGMGAPFLIGESHACSEIQLTRATK